MFRKYIALLIPVTLAGLASAQVAGAERAAVALGDLSSSIEGLASKASPAVVRISVHVRAPLEGESSEKTGFVTNQEATGSGVIVDSNGYIVTNNHVVSGARAEEITVTLSDGQILRPNRVWTDPESDVALLRLDRAPGRVGRS